MDLNLKKEIFMVCKDVRDYFESNPRILYGYHPSSFPKGWCGSACEHLRKRLKQELNIDCISRSGNMYDSDASTRNNHAWLEHEGFYIDITADQFNFDGYDNPPIMVTSDSSFHSQFSFDLK
ncbi:hypothetical protein QLG07_05010 [Erwinia sp. V90_4]|uniref:hypothetical protein n=1 Tax=Erwinia TaxID=551 RepID=UPI00249F6800|nr:hypothetical protein [Erwinia sp. V90_4]MDI3438809.1 hypothetical protein [Erwinia sp. V90_4]